MQRDPPFVVRDVRIGPMREKSLRAFRPTFLDRNAQRRPARLILGIEIRTGLDETDQHFLAAGCGGVMQGGRATLIADIHRSPCLDQEIAPARGSVRCRPMQGSRAGLVPGVHVGPGPNQGARHIQVGIPDGGAMQRSLAPPVAQVRIGPLTDEVADLMLGFGRGGPMQSGRAIEERIDEVFSPAHLIRLRLVRIGLCVKLFIAHHVLDDGVEAHPGSQLFGRLERLAAGETCVKFLGRRGYSNMSWHDSPPGCAVIVRTCLQAE